MNKTRKSVKTHDLGAHLTRPSLGFIHQLFQKNDLFDDLLAIDPMLFEPYMLLELNYHSVQLVV